MTPRREIQRFAIGAEERRCVVVRRVDGRAEVDRSAPLAIAVARGLPEVGFTVATRPLAREDQRASVAAERRLAVPLRAVDHVAEVDRCRPFAALQLGDVQVAVAASARPVAGRVHEHLTISRESRGAFVARRVDRLRQPHPLGPAGVGPAGAVDRLGPLAVLDARARKSGPAAGEVQRVSVGA